MTPHTHHVEGACVCERTTRTSSSSSSAEHTGRDTSPCRPHVHSPAMVPKLMIANSHSTIRRKPYTDTDTPAHIVTNQVSRRSRVHLLEINPSLCGSDLGRLHPKPRSVRLATITVCTYRHKRAHDRPTNSHVSVPTQAGHGRITIGHWRCLIER
jgi:hypothetical protein